MPARRRVSALLALWAAGALAACAPRPPALPGGPATPFAGAAAAYAEAVQDCRGVRTIAATLGLSGRAGGTRLRGSVDAGFEAPASLRLEMRHPIGRPIFILAARDGRATLLFPRDNLVLEQAGAVEIVEALVGLRIEPGELHALLSGCGFGVAAPPSEGREHAGGWVAVGTGDATAYLRRLDGRWRIAAATRPPLTVHYTAFAGGRPAALRLQAPDPAPADVMVTVSDVSLNLPLGPEVFEVQVPPDAEPLSLAELRRAGPLGGR